MRLAQLKCEKQIKREVMREANRQQRRQQAWTNDVKPQLQAYDKKHGKGGRGGGELDNDEEEGKLG